MVAKVITGKKLRGALHYNEHKVAEGKAELLLASGFAGDIDQLNFNQKLQRFENLLMLRPSVKTNTLHISLNFDAAEKISDQQMQQITLAYMEKIGFGDQPYIAYRHNDSAHDHIHVLTTNIQANSKVINLHNIGRGPSMQACRDIENDLGLVKAPERGFKERTVIRPIEVEKVCYGKLPTKRAISNTLTAVMANYKYASLPELNAILKQFNVVADRGSEDSAMYHRKGLIYSLLDEQGNKVGVPIKASAFYARPTLEKLEQQFAKNADKKQQYKPKLKERLDAVLAKQHTERTFTDTLKRRGVAVVFRRSADGRVYGITFVDHWNKTVFNGSDLGKAYTAKAITDQLLPERTPHLFRTLHRPENQQADTPERSAGHNPLEDLLRPATLPNSLLPKKKRRKKKKLKI